MRNSMINETFEQFRTEVAQLLRDLHQLITAINNPELEAVITDMRDYVREPFLFVVVGEIKAGKSSFVNALLQDDVCRVDPAPCTDVIQQMVYAPQKTESEINPLLRRIGLPIEILRQIAIVDTPGTNTIVAHHQEITERFIPNSGLVLFVFPAKNPHTRSAWEFLAFVKKQWRKRVVFVLQQADLATEKELSVNRSKLEEYAREHGIESPTIFATSAKWEAENDPRSGFDEIRRYIHRTVTGGDHFYLKLKSALESGEQMLRQVYEALQTMQGQLSTDKSVVGTIDRRLKRGRENTRRDIVYLANRLLKQYDRVAERIKEEFEAGFSVFNLLKRGFGSTIGRKKSVRVWLQNLQQSFETQLMEDFQDILAEGAIHLSAGMRDLGDQIMAALQDLDKPQIEGAQHLINFGNQREETLADIKNKLGDLIAAGFADETLAANPGNMATHLFGGSALTVVGAILLTTHITLLDITGGILTGVGVLLAGGVLVFKKGKIMRDFDRTLAEGRNRFEEQLVGKLTARFDLLHSRLGDSLEPFYEQVTTREQKLEPLMVSGETLQKRFLALGQRIEATVAD